MALMQCRAMAETKLANATIGLIITGLAIHRFMMKAARLTCRASTVAAEASSAIDQATPHTPSVNKLKSISPNGDH